MSKQSLLLVDGDTRSLRVLEVSLRKAGFSVTPASSVQDALDKLELHTPDLIISETTFAGGPDGFELRRRVRAKPELAEIPFVFITAETAIEDKIRGLELGVDDYLTKPIYIKEVVTRINILLQKRQRSRFEERKDGTRFAGRVADMPVVDVIQTIEISRKSGVINFTGERGRSAAIYFRDGRVIDAEAGTLQGEDAVYRLLTWNDGEFEVEFRTVRRREAISTSSQGLLMEGMRRLDEWSRLLEQLPPLSHRFEVDAGELAARLGDIPDENNRILRLIDGKRSLMEVIDASDFGDLECLQAISKLFFEGILIDLDPNERAHRDTGRPVPLTQLDAPTPMQEVASGPIQIDELARRSSVVPPPEPEAPPAPEPAPADAAPVAVDADAIDEEYDEPGPLMGGYRPSSLRLIDEAIAAAEAIDPSFLADDRKPAEHTIEADEPDLDGESMAGDDQPATEPGKRRFAATIRRDDSGLRMIGSLGRDRAEASGELIPVAPPAPAVAEPQREMVTILPRRATREVPTVEVDAEGEKKPASAEQEVDAPAVAPPVAAPRARDEAPPRDPASSVRWLIAITAMLAIVAVYLTFHKKPGAAVEHDAGAVAATPDDATALGVDERDASTFVSAAPSDASIPDARRVVAAPRDAGLARVAIAGDAAVDRTKEARDLADQAHDAVEEGDYEKALRLADESLKLRKKPQTYLIRAQALQRLERIDDALASVDQALQISDSYAPAWELKGFMLWSAQRKDEAREAMTRYLELDPNGKSAPAMRRLLEEPR